MSCTFEVAVFLKKNY